MSFTEKFSHIAVEVDVLPPVYRIGVSEEVQVGRLALSALCRDRHLHEWISLKHDMAWIND